MVDMKSLILKAGATPASRDTAPSFQKRRPWLESDSVPKLENVKEADDLNDSSPNIDNAPSPNPSSTLNAPSPNPSSNPSSSEPNLNQGLNYPSSNPGSKRVVQRGSNPSSNPSSKKGTYPSPNPSPNPSSTLDVPSSNPSSNPSSKMGRSSEKSFVPTAVNERHLLVMAMLYESTVTTGSLRTEPILNAYFCKRIGIADQGMRTLLKRFRSYGWLQPLSANDIRQNGTIHTLSDAVWRRMRDRLCDTLVQRGSNPSSNPSSKSLVSKLEDKDNFIPTNQQELYAYMTYMDDDFLKELSDVGVVWTDKDNAWACRNEIDPRVIAISLQHFAYDVRNGLIDKQGIKSYQAWFKGSLKKFGKYYSEGYMQIQARRRAVESDYLSQVGNENAYVSKEQDLNETS